MWSWFFPLHWDDQFYVIWLRKYTTTLSTEAAKNCNFAASLLQEREYSVEEACLAPVVCQLWPSDWKILTTFAWAPMLLFYTLQTHYLMDTFSGSITTHYFQEHRYVVLCCTYVCCTVLHPRMLYCVAPTYVVLCCTYARSLCILSLLLTALS
jgi:hypothetical protein